MVKDHIMLGHMARVIQVNHLDRRQPSSPVLLMHNPTALPHSNSNSNMPISKEQGLHNSQLKDTTKDTVSNRPTTTFRPDTNRKRTNTALLRLGKLPFRPTIRHNRTTQALHMLQINKFPPSKVLLVSNVTMPSQLSSLNKDNTLQALDSQALHSESVRAPETIRPRANHGSEDL